jgi:hypothetical protein
MTFDNCVNSFQEDYEGVARNSICERQYVNSEGDKSKSRNQKSTQVEEMITAI